MNMLVICRGKTPRCNELPILVTFPSAVLRMQQSRVACLPMTRSIGLTTSLCYQDCSNALETKTFTKGLEIKTKTFFPCSRDQEFYKKKCRDQDYSPKELFWRKSQNIRQNVMGKWEGDFISHILYRNPLKLWTLLHLFFDIFIKSWS